MSEFGDGGANQCVPQQSGEDEQREEAASEHAARRNLVQVPTVDDSCEVYEIHFFSRTLHFRGDKLGGSFSPALEKKKKQHDNITISNITISAKESLLPDICLLALQCSLGICWAEVGRQKNQGGLQNPQFQRRQTFINGVIGVPVDSGNIFFNAKLINILFDSYIQILVLKMRDLIPVYCVKKSEHIR